MQQLHNPDPDETMSRLRQERLRRGWSLTRLTKETGIATPHLSQVERGRCPAWPRWQMLIAKALGLRADLLFKGKTVKLARRRAV